MNWVKAIEEGFLKSPKNPQLNFIHVKIMIEEELISNKS